MYRVGEFAERAGVTVRALHHYDRLGLLKPRRGSAGYRTYADSDLERLEQIVALRFLGVPLREAGKLLANGAERLPEALAVQKELLEQKRRALDRAIQAIAEAEVRLKEQDGGVAAALSKIIKVIEMETNNNWMDKYHTAESKAAVEERKSLWSPELQERVSRQWAELLAEVEQALGSDPAGETAQALAGRWNALVGEFTGGNPAVAASVGKMWRDRDNWPAQIDEKAPRINPEAFVFIQKANAAARKAG